MCPVMGVIRRTGQQKEFPAGTWEFRDFHVTVGTGASWKLVSGELLLEGGPDISDGLDLVKTVKVDGGRGAPDEVA